MHPFLPAGEPVELFAPRASEHPVPIHLAALTDATARLAGQIAQGIMPFLPSRHYLRGLVAAARES